MQQNGCPATEEATLNPICVRPPIRLSRVPPCDRRPIALVKSLSFPRKAKAQAGETHFRGRYQLSSFKWTCIAGARQAPSLTALPHASVCSGGFLVSQGGCRDAGSLLRGAEGCRGKFLALACLRSFLDRVLSSSLYTAELYVNSLICA
jgi:hypothetical protein